MRIRQDVLARYTPTGFAGRDLPRRTLVHAARSAGRYMVDIANYQRKATRKIAPSSCREFLQSCHLAGSSGVWIVWPHGALQIFYRGTKRVARLRSLTLTLQGKAEVQIRAPDVAR
jgi:hypothetical protein